MGIMLYLYLTILLMGLMNHATAAEHTNQTRYKTLKYLTMAEGKVFYVDMETERDFWEAKRYCDLAGIHMATITSEAQAEALAKAYSGAFYSDCWLNAMDSGSIQQFNWDTNNSAVELLSAQYFDKATDAMTCLTIQPIEGGTAHYRNWRCTSKLGTLCHTS